MMRFLVCIDPYDICGCSVDRLNLGRVLIEVRAGSVFADRDNIEHIIFVTGIIMNHIEGSMYEREDYPQIIGYRLDFLEKSSATMEEYIKTHPLRTKPHMVVQIRKILRLFAAAIISCVVIVPPGFWQQQFVHSPGYVLVAGDAGSGDDHDATEDMTLTKVAHSCNSFIAWATRTEIRLPLAWVDTILAVVWYRVLLFLCNRARADIMGSINTIALDNIAPSFVYQVCHELFVLCSVFWLSLSNYLCAVSGLPFGHGGFYGPTAREFVLELLQAYTHAHSVGKD